MDLRGLKQTTAVQSPYAISHFSQLLHHLHNLS